jgi:hypothetical protein
MVPMTPEYWSALAEEMRFCRNSIWSCTGNIGIDRERPTCSIFFPPKFSLYIAERRQFTELLFFPALH